MKKKNAILLGLLSLSSIAFCKENMVINSSFEASNAGEWTLSKATISNEMARTGSYSAKLQNSSGIAKIIQQVPVTPGQQLTLSAFVYISENPTGGQARLWGQYLFSDGTSSGSGTIQATPVTTIGEWCEITTTLTTPANASFIEIDLRTQSGIIAYMDDVSLTTSLTVDYPAQPPYLKDVVATGYANRNFFLGGTTGYNSFATQSYRILRREFSYVTPNNDFKQTAIHPSPGVWNWTKPDAWIDTIAKTRQILRMHGPISPQASKWALDDSRTAAELSQNMDEFMTALCQRYNSNPLIKWMDVVNETIATNTIKDPLGNQAAGDWFGPRAGTDKWENPWPTIGYDESTPLRVPHYIDRAFELANQYAPNIKQIINQHGAFEEVVWEKMKLLVQYLRGKGRRVDGIGFQAHLDVGWEKIPGNLQRMSSFVDWCHANNLEFHITELNVYLKSATDLGMEEQQADTYEAVIGLLLSKLNSGTIAINFWNMRFEDNSDKGNLNGTLWDNDGVPQPSYFRIRNLLTTSTGMENNQQASKIKIYKKEGITRIQGLQQGVPYSLIDAYGKSVLSGLTDSEELLLTAPLPQGIYVLQQGNECRKFIN